MLTSAQSCSSAARTTLSSARCVNESGRCKRCVGDCPSPTAGCVQSVAMTSARKFWSMREPAGTSASASRSSAPCRTPPPRPARSQAGPLSLRRRSGVAAPVFHETARLVSYLVRKVTPGEGESDTMSDEGFLILADISGFTAFVTATELEHGAPVTGELLETVMQRLAPPLEIQELEGDAVFAIGADRLVDSHLVPTVLLDTFRGFRDLQHRIALDDTCSCR